MKLSIPLPDSASVKRFAGGCLTAGGALLLVLALSVFVFDAGLLMFGVDYNGILLAYAVFGLVAGTTLVLRKHVPAIGRAVLAALAHLLGFPVMYVRDNIWPVYFSTVAAGLAYSLGAFWFNAGGTVTVWVLGASLFGAAAGGLYHLLRHKWAGYIGLGIASAMILLGAALLYSDSQQVAAYNYGMQANAVHDWEAQNKLLEASVSGYERARRQNQLWELLFPTPQTDLAALAHFHKANGLLQSPSKGKEAYNELCKSLMRNPGNRYIGLTPEEAAVREDNARHAQRNIEKLMRTGQDGGAGQPNGKQGQGQPQQGKQPSRDPGKEPQPSSGRHPRDVL
jgi:hypothetical protein